MFLLSNFSFGLPKLNDFALFCIFMVLLINCYHIEMSSYCLPVYAVVSVLNLFVKIKVLLAELHSYLVLITVEQLLKLLDKTSHLTNPLACLLFT